MWPSSVISGMLASAFDSGQSRFAACAICWKCRLADAGHRGLHRQRDPVDQETVTLLDQAHAGLRVDFAGGQPGPIAGKRERHREASRVRSAQDFLRIGAAAIVFEAAREAVRIVLERACLGADLTQSLLALAPPSARLRSFRSSRSPGDSETQRARRRLRAVVDRMEKHGFFVCTPSHAECGWPGWITGVIARYVAGRRAASNLRSSGRTEDRGLMVGSHPGPMLRMSRGAACFAAGGPACGGDTILVAHPLRNGRTVTPVLSCLHQHIAMNWRRAVWIVLFVAVLSKAWGQWETSGSSSGRWCVAPDEPLQTNANGAPAVVLGRWTLTPRATYDVTARILGREDYRFDPIADLAPLDLALGWGPMSDNRVLKTLKISQGARFYSWRPVTESLPMDLREVTYHSANTHVIPANASVASKLSRAAPGRTGGSPVGSAG